MESVQEVLTSIEEVLPNIRMISSKLYDLPEMRGYNSQLTKSCSGGSAWSIPYQNFEHNLGTFETYKGSGSNNDIANMEGQKRCQPIVVTFRGDLTVLSSDSEFAVYPPSSVEDSDGSYISDTSAIFREVQEPTFIGRFEEFFVKGMPREYRHGTTKDAFPVKNRKINRSSFLVYAVGQLVIFMLLLAQFLNLGLLSADSWMLVLGIIDILFALIIAGYAFVNIFGYLAARKLLIIKFPSMVKVLKMKPTHDQARFALWMNAGWVLCGLLSMGVNFIVLLIKRCLGDPPISLDLLIIYITITVVYIIFAIVHRKLAYCCWYNWYRYYDQTNSLGTWGSSNNRNVKKSVVFAFFQNKSPGMAASLEKDPSEYTLWNGYIFDEV